MDAAGRVAGRSRAAGDRRGRTARRAEDHGRRVGSVETMVDFYCVKMGKRGQVKCNRLAKGVNLAPSTPQGKSGKPLFRAFGCSF